MQWLFSNLGGRKFTLAIVGAIGVVVMACMHVIEGPEALETLKWIIIGIAGAIAVDDVGKSLGTEKKPDGE